MRFIAEANASPAANSWNDGVDSGSGSWEIIFYLYLLGLATATALKLYHGKYSDTTWASIPVWGAAWSLMWVMIFQIIALLGLPVMFVYQLFIK